MTKEKMNIHKALCELKTLDSRIEDKIADFEPVAANRESNRRSTASLLRILSTKQTMITNPSRI